MASPTSPAARLQVIALHEAKCNYKQIAAQLGLYRQTVAKIIKQHDADQKAKDAASIATREDILRRMTKIMQVSDKPTDSIAAAKLIAMMEGWLTPTGSGDASVTLNILGSDVRVLEREYHELTGRALLESPTTHEHAQGEPLPLGEAQSSLLGQPDAPALATVEENEVEGGPIPPASGGDGI